MRASRMRRFAEAADADDHVVAGCQHDIHRGMILGRHDRHKVETTSLAGAGIVDLHAIVDRLQRIQHLLERRNAALLKQQKICFAPAI